MPGVAPGQCGKSIIAQEEPREEARSQDNSTASSEAEATQCSPPATPGVAPDQPFEKAGTTYHIGAAGVPGLDCFDGEPVVVQVAVAHATGPVTRVCKLQFRELLKSSVHF